MAHDAEGCLVGRHDQALADLREVPSEVDFRLRLMIVTGEFQRRWDEIVAAAELSSDDGKVVLLNATKEVVIDFVELLRRVLAEREKATAERLQK